MPETTNQILQELTKLSIKMEGLEEKYGLLTVSISDANQHVLKKIEQMNQVISGNGDPESGLVVRLTLIEKQAERHEERFKAFEDWKRWATRIFFGSFLTAVAAGVVYAIKAVTFKP